MQLPIRLTKKQVSKVSPIARRSLADHSPASSSFSALFYSSRQWVYMGKITCDIALLNQGQSDTEALKNEHILKSSISLKSERL